MVTHPSADEPRDEAGWLAVFERLGVDGTFDHEPEFPQALAEFRAALDRARVSADPPFEPPAGFLPEHPSPRVRAVLWRTPERFPDLDAALDWLTEMLERAVDGVPPVTEAEFAGLAAWFAAHEAELYARALSSQLLDVGDGRTVWCANLRYELAKGPRAVGAGRAAEDVRQLKARYEGRLVPGPAG